MKRTSKDATASASKSIKGITSPRCRQGDLALVLISKRGNEGRFVTVGEFWGNALCDGLEAENVWAVSVSGQTHNPETGKPWITPDHCLLPIRPGDLDESETDERSLVKGESS
jgi:hypothetical protein